MINKKNKSGMSLLVLVVTILSMIILSGVVVMGLIDNNPIEKAQNAKALTNISAIESEVYLYTTKQLSLSKAGVDLYPVERDNSGKPILADDKYDANFKNSLPDELKNIVKKIQDKYGKNPSGATFNLNGFYPLDTAKVTSTSVFEGDFIIFVNGKNFFVLSLEGIKYEGQKKYFLFPETKELVIPNPNPNPNPDPDPEPEKPWVAPAVLTNILDYYKYDLIYANGKNQIMVSLAYNFKNAINGNKNFTDSQGNVWKPGTPLPNPGSVYNGKKVENMKYMFQNCTASTLDLTNFDTSNIITMENMFDNCKAKVVKMDNFDTTNVEYMTGMFARSKITNIDLSVFETPNLQYVWSMFSSAEAESINLENFDTTNVKYFDWMFAYVKKANSINISNWNTTKLLTMSNMFKGCEVEKITIENLQLPELTAMESMFYDCKSKTVKLTNLNLPKLNNVVNMFYGCTAEDIKLTQLNTSGITNLRYLFSDSKARTIDLTGLNTSNVTNMESMFERASCDYIIGLNTFNTKKVSDFRKMFYEAKAKELDISSFEFKDNYVDLVGMFAFSDTKTVYIKKQEYINQVKKDPWSNQYTNVENYIIKP